MPEERSEDVKIPSAAAAIVGEFSDRAAADKAMECLSEAGFEEGQVSFVAHGAQHVDGKFVPGALYVTVHPDGRDADVEKILNDCGAIRIKTGAVSAVGEVTEIGEEEPQEAPSA